MIDEKIVGYIKESLVQGKTKGELYKELLNSGWSLDVIEENFATITSEGEKVDTQKRTIQIIVTIGAILIGAGIFSFIASNWQEMTKPVKIAIIVATMLVAYTAGWFLREQKQAVKTGEALLLLGTIIYGAGIFLVAQMFNMRANWPDGFILWMLGTIAMAFAIESFPLFYLAIPLGIVAVIGHPFIIFAAIFGYDSFLLTSTLLLAISTAACFISGYLIYQRRSPELKDFY